MNQVKTFIRVAVDDTFRPSIVTTIIYEIEK